MPTLTGLTPGTTYYGRMVATSAGGTTDGAVGEILTPVHIGEFGRRVKVVPAARGSVLHRGLHAQVVDR